MYCLTTSVRNSPLFKRVRKTVKRDYKLRHVCPSALNNSAPNKRIFVIFHIRELLKKSVKKIQASFKSDEKNGGTLYEDVISFMIISHSVLLRMKNAADKSSQQNIKTHNFMVNNVFFENRAVYEIMWKNTVQTEWSKLQYGACVLHAGYQRLQTRSQNT